MTFRPVGPTRSQLAGSQAGTLSVPQGIYILYGNHGPYYCGLTTKQGLGKRLRDHREDSYADKWDRFLWFGFRRVLLGTDDLVCVISQSWQRLRLEAPRKSFGMLKHC